MSNFISSQDFDASSLIIGNAMPQSNGTFRSVLKYKYKDGTVGPFYIVTPKLFSFGVLAQVQMGDVVKEDLSNVQAYVLPLCLCDNSNLVSSEEQALLDALEKIPEVIKTHCTTAAFNA